MSGGIVTSIFCILPTCVIVVFEPPDIVLNISVVPDLPLNISFAPPKFAPFSTLVSSIICVLPVYVLNKVKSVLPLKTGNKSTLSVDKPSFLSSSMVVELSVVAVTNVSVIPVTLNNPPSLRLIVKTLELYVPPVAYISLVCTYPVTYATFVISLGLEPLTVKL